MKSNSPVGLILLISTFAMSIILRSGTIAASTDKFFKSAPEKPFVNFTKFSISH